MVMAATLSQKMGLIDEAFVARLKSSIERAGLPVKAPVIDAKDNVARYLELMQVDKKTEGGQIKFVLIDGPGKAIVKSAPLEMVTDVIDTCSR